MSRTLSTVRGATRLTFDSIQGIVNSVEQMHETIARRPLPFTRRPDRPTRAHGLIASSVYSAIRGVNAVVREGVDRSMQLVPVREQSRRPSREQVAWIAALNGVCGDHLETTGNPLGIEMQFSTPEQPLPLEDGDLASVLPEASPHLAVFVHGLCLSPFSWRQRGAPAIGDSLADDLDVTPVYLGYNTGRHISTNGRELAAMVGRLCAAWPVPVASLSLVGHSMGGLVIRSACCYAEAAGEPWLERLSRVVCLGTPHHGAALEKAGSLFDRSMQTIQYVDPLLFGKYRSVGIKDLRHGNLLDDDWQVEKGDEDSVPYEDARRPVPLLDDVDYYFVAASIGRDERDLRGQILGDFLVRLGSATGGHRDQGKRLPVPPEHCRIFHERNHFELLSDPRVHRQVREWFGEARD